MGDFKKNCPVCDKKFTSLLEYTTHIGKDHRDIPLGKLFEFGKESKRSLRD